MPRVTVVLPVHNGERYVLEAAQSVLNQRYADFELLVVDDGSTDASAEIVGQLPGIRVVSQRVGGQSAARNLGVASSDSDDVAFIDQDDIWYPTKLGQQVEVLDAQPHVGVVYSDFDEIDARGDIVTCNVIATHGFRHPKRSIVDCLSHDMFILPTVAAIRRDVFEKVGGFDERLQGYEDDDLFLRLFPQVRFEFLPASLAQWRIHADSYSARSEGMDISRARYIDLLIDRYPDSGRDRNYVSDLVVPRFIRTYLQRYARSLQVGDVELAGHYKRDLHAVLGDRLSLSQKAVCAAATAPRPVRAAVWSIGRRLPMQTRHRLGV